MEDIRKKLEFRNPHIQHQAMWKLYSEMEKKATAQGRITADSPEMGEVKVLWDALCGDNQMVAETAGEVLRQLVVSQLADFTWAMHGVLNRVPSARSLSGVVKTIGQMLILQAVAIEDTEKCYTCPYTLRAPAHPFITVLTHRPASWSLLLAQVEDTVLHHNTRVQNLSTELLRPFVSFVLLDPSPALQQAALLRHQLQNLLLRQCAKSSARDTWFTFLCDLLPCYQANTQDAIFQLQDHVRHLLDTVLTRDVRHPASTCSKELRRVTQVAVSLLLPVVQNGLDMRGLLDSVETALRHFPECLSLDGTLSQLCNLLMELGPFCPPSVLALVEQAVLARQATSGSGLEAAMLVLPLLQTVSGPAPLGTRGGPLISAVSRHRQTVSKATAALRAVERTVMGAQDLSKGDSQVEVDMIRQGDYLLGGQVKTDSLMTLMTTIANHINNTCLWLSSLRHHLSELKETSNMSWQTTCLVSAVLLLHRNAAVTSLALPVLVHIARLDNTKAPLFLPLLLYTVERVTEPATHLLLLEHIPRMAQHKLCVPPVLKTLQALMTSSKLRAVAIRLMTSLWQLQDRVFPQLLKAIGEELSSSTSPVDVVLAKAMAVREICRLKPEQHGSEMLSPLSTILQTANGPQGAAPSALALEGLYFLCEAEVLDIQSAWGGLAKQLASETRGVVVVKICQLLSLVPSLACKTPDYEKFLDECVSTLWRYTRNTHISVQGAAFQALASYSLSSFRASHLPREVCDELHVQVELIHQQQENSQVTVDNLFTYIPGVCFTRLLTALSPQVLPDYQALLSCLAGKEVDELPRGIYHAANRRQGMVSGNQDKAISSIPDFISRLYGKTSLTGLRPALAAALLFCYDPPMEVGRDGRPRKHYIVRHGKHYSSMLDTLLTEVPVQPSEWHRTVVMPQAWLSFIERLCLALIESRLAELDLQVKQGHITEDQREENNMTAWLFVRDTVVDMLKTKSKGPPGQQANTVMALSALVVFMDRHAAGLDPELLKECDRATEHLSHSHWLTVAVDTVLSIRDLGYRPRGDLLGFGQQRSAEDRAAASNLAQGCASVCVSFLIPTLYTGQTEVVFLLLRRLSLSLPGEQRAPDLGVLLFHNGLGLGMALATLWEDGFDHLAGTAGERALWQTMEKLEETSTDQTRENRAGSLLGLGLALSGMCQHGKAETRSHVRTMWEKLSALMDSTLADDSSYQALCFALAVTSGSAFTSNILKMQDITATLNQLETAHRLHPQVTGCSLGLGMLCYTLSKMAHPGVAPLRQTLTSEWLKAVTSQGPSPREKIAALNGLLALIGSEQTLIVVQSGVSLTSSDVKVSEVVESVTRMVHGDPDLGIQCNAAWMLGHLHLSACAVAESRSSVPPDFGYLPEASLLRALVDFLLAAGKSDLETVSGDHVKVALVALQEEVRRVLPPLNWAAVLSPLTRMSFGEECQNLCLTLALSQGTSSPSASTFLSSWLTPPLALTLTDDSKRSLYGALPDIMKTVSPSVLTTFLERCCTLVFSPAGWHPALACIVLRGLTEALRVADPPPAVITVLHSAAGQWYSMLPERFCPSVYKAMAECLSSVPDDIFDSITVDDYSSGTCTLRGLFIGCYLVARGNQPITLLNGLIDSAMNSPKCCDESVLYVLAHCLWRLAEHRKEGCGPMVRLNWLVELLGHTRNVATGAIPLSSPTQTLAKAVEFSVLVVAMALNLLTVSRSLPDFALDPAMLKVAEVKDDEESNMEVEIPPGIGEIPAWCGNLKDCFLQQLPSAVLAFERTPWDQLLPKVFDWLLMMSQLSDDVLPADVRQYLIGSLKMLRHSTTYRKTSHWTRVVATV